MKDFAQRIAHLTPKQRALYELQLKRMGVDGESKQHIPRRTGEGPWPASIDQTALWFFHQLDPETTAYNIGTGERLTGQLDIEALERAFNEVVRRHEVLRTTFRVIDGKPYQVIAPSLELKIPLTDLRKFPKEKRFEIAMKESSRWLRKPFDLEKGPLIRMPLFRLDEEDWVLTGNLNHTITDWWSIQNLFNEIAIIYRAFINGRPSPLAELPIQFADYSEWRNGWLQSEAVRREKDYWLKELEGANTTIDLFTDYPRPAVASHHGARVFNVLPHATTEMLRAINRQAKTSPLMAVMAIAFAFLYRYSGAKDILMGLATGGRDYPEMEPLIGYLLNIQVIRARMQDDPTFLELLAQVRRAVFGGLDHKDLPFRALVEELNPERDMSRPPIYQVEFVYVTEEGMMNQNHREADRGAAGDKPIYHRAGYQTDRQSAYADIQIGFSERANEFETIFEYRTDLFKLETVRNMSDMMVRLAGILLANPEVPISKLPMLEAPDRVRLLADWNPKVPLPEAPSTIHGGFEALVARDGRRTALICGGESLSYEALNQKAEALATVLSDRGVGPETLVGLCLERSPSMLIALLAVLKSGGAYVPLDPTHPSERLRYIAASAGFSLLLAEAGTAETWKDSGVALLRVDQDQPTPARTPVHKPVDPDNPAYVIFTSGSTGKPKGVAVTHRSVCAFLAAMAVRPGIQADDRLLAVTTLSFDIAGLELYLPLLTGAAVVLASKEETADAARLIKLLETQRITVMQATPATWKMLLAAGWAGSPELTMICGGEALPNDLKEKLLYKGRTLWNLYGPTETTIWSMCASMRESEDVHLGRPIQGTSIYLVDQYLRPQPQGIPGELFIGGAGLARGYWDRPDLTAERFLPDPFAETPGARFYRTGDLVIHRPDNRLEFAGRIDHQVKVRGFRIELGEIESVLRRHPEVGEAAADVRGARGEGDKHLVAYVVAKSDEKPDQNALRTYLNEFLPAYMVPAFFVYLETLPQTPNGKLDRKALPDPDLSASSKYVPARNKTEQILSDIWRDILKARQVGIHDNFFHIGGDSIISILMISRAREKGLIFDPIMLFQNQTIAELAAAVETKHAVEAEQDDVTGTAPVTPEQTFLLNRENAAMPAVKALSLVLEVGEWVRPENLETALGVLYRHHDALRLTFEQENGVWQQRYMRSGEAIPFERIDLATGTAAEVTGRIAQFARTIQWNPQTGPLVRFAWFDCGPSRSGRLLFTAHPLVLDEASRGICLTDLENLLDLLDIGGTAALPAKTHAFKLWSQRVAELGDAKEIEADREFWLRQVADCKPARTDHEPSGQGRTPSMRRVERIEGEDFTRSMLEEAPNAYRTTTAEMLLAALALAYQSWSGTTELPVMVEASERVHDFEGVDFQHTVGRFAALYPMRFALAGTIEPGQALRAVKEQNRKAPRAGLSFGLLCGKYSDLAAALEKTPVWFGFSDPIHTDSRDNAAFRTAIEDGVPDPASSWGHPAPLHVNAAIRRNQLTVSFEFREDLYRDATIENLADNFIGALEALVHHCLSGEAGGYTPSDFKDVDMTQDDLDDIMSQL